jgi:soluble lytic murein transglycosylase-like protein
MAPPTGTSDQIFSTLEKQYQLPQGLLDSDWAAESGRGRHMLSSAGAQGHFQFMPGTAREYNLQDPNNLGQSAVAAARYFSDLLKHYGGDAAKAIAGYNWGQGNLDKDIREWGASWAEHLPQETAGYIKKVLGGIAINQARLGGGDGTVLSQGATPAGGKALTNSTTINVHGSGDPVRTAMAVEQSQRRVNADLVRHFTGAVLA